MKTYIGVDVGKNFLDISVNDKHYKVDNNISGYNLLHKHLQLFNLDKEEMIIVLEPSGGYEKEFIGYCIQKDYRTHLAHANKVKSFSRSKGYMAKTDKIDCQIIAEYAKFMNVTKDKFQLSKQETLIKQLIIRREQLRSWKQQEKNRLDKFSEQLVIRSIKKTIKYIDKEICVIENQLFKIQNKYTEIDERVQLLSSIPSVGKLTAQYLIAYLPELGTLSNAELSSLVGVAPYCKDSGKHSGKRFIQGGRQRLRNQLYMAAVSSVRHNIELSKFYKRLRENGKPAKIALVAVIRKLLSMLNAVIKRNYPWEIRENIA